MVLLGKKRVEILLEHEISREVAFEARKEMLENNERLSRTLVSKVDEQMKPNGAQPSSKHESHV